MGDLARPAGSKISSQSAASVVTRRPWESRKDNQTGSMRHQDLIMHRVCNIVYNSSLFSLNNCNREQCLILIICFRRINHMVVKNHVHSSSDVHDSRVGHNTYKEYYC
jgi:hypothetical protein